ncbi:hypothetical protein NU08_3515 [Flavobacterium anhuiense]|uniref:Toxin YqcG C-terminal domain-containing protein n=1 Tax=Flavobacterium anhuiense TaxID=459526 RepID=A0A444VW11_9FLAO|nr:GH-E family nuclease [Flavobacterium anhuiense]RYJ37523.1 hypothetical protein NU08_3515 [Flavobacterium anhuiense]
MTQQHKKISENQTIVIAANATQRNNTSQLRDNRVFSVVQRKLQEKTLYNTTSIQLKKGDGEEKKKKKNKKKRKRQDSESDEDSSGEFIPPQAKKQKRFHVPTDITEQVIKSTAHKRVNVNNRYDEIYTCPACRRPLAYTKKGGKKLELTRYAYTSKSGNYHEQRALALDHFPTWDQRERDLKSRGASDNEMKEDHNDPDGLRAFCKVCNESHKYERKKKVDYESDDDEEGYHTSDDEPENKGFYKDFRYDPDSGSGGSGIIA